MNWIKLLYPKPTFDFKLGPVWFQRVHTTALTITYYITHTLALVGLSLIYFLVIVPLKIKMILFKQDPLALKKNTNLNSYFVPPGTDPIDFERMF